MPESPKSPPRVPDYQLLRKIGGGSYGDVWLARGVTGALRAVKIVSRGRFDSERPYRRELEGITRFQKSAFGRARQLALLHVGFNEAEGFFFYVMELADDVERGPEIDPDSYIPLTLKERLAATGRLPADEALRLSVDLTEALAELHGLGLIHRDVKPSNLIFVNGRPKFADVGLVSSAEVTLTSVGTPGYEAPEGPGTKAADLYSLGKVLYVATTGMVAAEFPRLPPELIGWADSARVLELNEVITRACAADPADRYPELPALLADLRLIEAGRSLKELALLRRRWRQAGRFALVAGGVLLLAFAFLAQRNWAARELARQEREARKASELQERKTREALYRAELDRTQLALQLGDLGLARKALQGAASPGLGGDLRGFEWYALNDQVQGDPARVYSAEADSWEMAALSPDGLRLAALGDDQVVRVWLGEAREPFATFPGVSRVGGFSSDGEHISVSTRDRQVGWLSLISGQSAEWMPVSGTIVGTWGNPGRLLLIDPPSDPKIFRLWDLEKRHEVARLPLAAQWAGWSVSGAAASSNGQWLAVSFFDERTPLWRRALVVMDWATGRELWRDETPERVGSLEFSPDSQTLAVGMAGLGIRVYPQAGAEVPSSAGQFELRGHQGQIWSLRFSPDGRTLASAGEDRSVRLWDVGERQPRRRLVGHERTIRSLEWSSSGGELVSAGEDGSVRVWNPATSSSLSILTNLWDDGLGGMAVLPVGDRMAVTDRTGNVAVFDLSQSRLEQTLTNAFMPLEWIGAEGVLWTLSLEWTLQRWDLAKGGFETVGAPLLSGPAPLSWATSTRSARLALGFRDGRAEVFDVQGSRQLQATSTKTSAVWSVGLSEDGAWLAVGKEDGAVELWSIGDRRRTELVTEASPVKTLVFSPDRRWLIAGAMNGRLSIYDLSSTNRVATLQGHGGAVRAAVFSPDGQRLVTGGNEGAVVFWESPTWSQLTSFQIPQEGVGAQDSGVSQLGFNRTGTRLLAFTEDGRVLTWEARR